MARIFISRRPEDSAAADRLASELRGAGHEVHVAEWDRVLGDSIVKGVEIGPQEKTFVVLCIAAAEVTPLWMGSEWLSALNRQMKEHGVRLLPCRLTDGVPPSILSKIKYADFVDNWSAAAAAILRTISRVD